MITIPAQRRDAQTTEMKNFHFDSIQIKDSTTNISDVFSIFWRDTKIRTLYYMKFDLLSTGRMCEESLDFSTIIWL